ncbi:MAG: phospholipase D family protein [Candidatus Aenigmarchaeota archaeon]|nr:phospholipase D family protein [Candidatus Aenigmarchaeota archaeon]
MMKQSRIDVIVNALKVLDKKGEVSGRDILRTLEKLCDVNELHLYAMLNEQIIKSIKVSRDIKDYKFKILKDGLSNKQKISNIFEDLIADDFVLIASYPPGKIEEKYKVEQLYPRLCRLILSAKRSLVLINPYFDKKGLDKLLPYIDGAAKNGVKIRLICRKGKEPDALIGAIKSRIGDNLELKEFGGLGYFLHAKCIIADDKLAYIGSANITGTSLGSNLELGVLFTGSKVKQLSQFLDRVLSFEGDDEDG